MNHAPSFVLGNAPKTPPRRRSEWVWLGALALGLLLQLGWLQRDVLAANAGLRPTLEATCRLLHCQLPAWHEPAAFSMLSRDVIALPEHPQVLRVQASFRNDAAWPQPVWGSGERVAYTLDAREALLARLREALGDALS